MKLNNPPFIAVSNADADIDLWPERDGRTLRMTNNLSANRNVGLNGTGYDIGERVRVCRDSAAPGAFTVAVKTGTAAGGTLLGTMVASKNGFIEAEWDGSKFVLIAQGVAS